MSVFSVRLKKRRDELDLTLAQIADQVGVTEATVQRWESGSIKNLKHERIGKLAEALHVTPAYLMGWSDSYATNLPPLPGMKGWKVLGGTACGDPLYKDFSDETVIAPADIDADCAFHCVGDSMIGARVLDGDIVFVKLGHVDDGQIAVVRIGEEYTLKRIYRGEDYIELRAENPAYPPKIIRGELDNAEIIGRAVQFLSRVV